MAIADNNVKIARQHLIDPEICIRCNTCEATCPVGAVTHDERSYVVKFDACNACGACIAPCPTGAIDNWRQVVAANAYSVDEQLTWDSLPPQEELSVESTGAELPPEVERLTSIAGSIGKAPHSAERPAINLFGMRNPAVATVVGNFRLTGVSASGDVRHIVLDLGCVAFPVLEGQSIGTLPPGMDESGKPHYVRLYSVASPRNGERPNYNNLSLTVKRVTHDHNGEPTPGVGSNYMCDLKIGDQVRVVGPYGATFLMPNHPGSSLLMICTGTGSAPMRAMTEWRRRRRALNEGGKLMLFFGARAPDELPYFGPLMNLPKDFIDVNLAFSRVPGQPKRHVQDAIRESPEAVVRLLQDADSYIYVCGIKGMEQGVEAAFADVCRQHHVEWTSLRRDLVEQNRYHIETY